MSDDLKELFNKDQSHPEKKRDEWQSIALQCSKEYQKKQNFLSRFRENLLNPFPAFALTAVLFLTLQGVLNTERPATINDYEDFAHYLFDDGETTELFTNKWLDS